MLVLGCRFRIRAKIAKLQRGVRLYACVRTFHIRNAAMHVPEAEVMAKFVDQTFYVIWFAEILGLDDSATFRENKTKAIDQDYKVRYITCYI